MWLNKTVLHSYSLGAPHNWRSKERSFLMKITHFIHRSTDCKTVVERSLLLDLQGHNPQIRVCSRYHWIFWTNYRVLGENLLPFCRWKLDRPSRTKKTRHLPSKPMKKRSSRWRMMLWTSMTVISWFACKSLSDWVRYLVIVTCTGKSGIFRAQPVSLRGSNPDYSGRSASRVNVKKITLICMQLVMISLKQLRCRKNKPYFLNGSSYFSAIYSSVGLIINVNLHLDLVTQSFTIIYIHHTSLSSFDAQILWCLCVFVSSF